MIKTMDLAYAGGTTRLFAKYRAVDVGRIALRRGLQKLELGAFA